jgi:hypothetical protein
MVELSDVEPVVWRRLRVSSGATLPRAARVLAVAMGWPIGRPSAFATSGLRYEVTGPRGDGRASSHAVGTAEGDDVRLRQLLPDSGAEVEFEYGDDHAAWHLVVRLERVLPPDDELRTPLCLDGAGAAPPVDVGGPWAYEEWRGGDVSRRSGNGWDTELGASPPPQRAIQPRFNADVVNAELERLR